MSEQALPIAIRAQERADSAHKRLDGINGSMRRVDDKLGDIDGKLDAVLIKLALADGANQAKSGILESKRFWFVLVAGVCTSSAFVLVVTLLTRHPT